MTFYINSIVRGNDVCLTYCHEDEVKYARIRDYKPTLFYQNHSGGNSGFTELVSGINLSPKQFDNIRQANKAIKDAREVEGLTIYGNRNFNLTFLHENFANMEKSYNEKYIRGFNIDIECPADFGFPDVGRAEWPINLMTIYDTFTDKFQVWGLNECDLENLKDALEEKSVSLDQVDYRAFETEDELLADMIEWWQQNYPAYVTGWNTSTFDLPYLCNRLRNLGFDIDKLSPWNTTFIREGEFMGKPEYKVYIDGVADLDYIELYKKNRFITRESYKLGVIGEVEGISGKVDFSEEANNLRTLHKVNWSKYVLYNIQDVNLVKMLDEKLGYLSITFAVAYAAGINFDDVSSPVATWENIFYRQLIRNRVVLPPKQSHDKVNFEGGYVKPPHTGKHRWVCSFDLNSLYPHIIMGWNISPETITPKMAAVNVNHMVEGLEFNAPDGDLAIAPSGNTFRRNVQGVAGQQMERLYKERKSIKGEMLTHEQNVVTIKDAIKNDRALDDMLTAYGASDMVKALAEAERQQSLCDGGQQVRKILLNSFYGALANVHFCLYDLRLAESITKSGQLAIRWIGRIINEQLNEMLGTDVDYVVYTDTDSVYVKLEEIVKRMKYEDRPTEEIVEMLDQFCESKMQKIIDVGYQQLANYCNAYDQKMIMAREVISDNSVFCAKKRYMMSVWNSEGVAFKEPKIKTMGLDVVKSSTPQFVRDAMKNTIKLMLNGQETEVQKYIKEFKTQFEGRPPEEIAFPRGVNKLQETYCGAGWEFKQGKTVPINSRAAITYNKLIDEMGLDLPEILPADKIKFIHLTEPNKLRQNVIGFIDVLPKEFDVHRKIDYDTMFEKTYLKPMRDILELIGWSVKPQATLDGFFS